ncbi:MAG: DEAD/DEAH box helicase [Tissierellales bacterium]|nr:DEAD/DEAH box helicase [Tissierellales bacterium]MBN2828140.1 DEAD/DEAH box helicase [Tissierellales bacterium]
MLINELQVKKEIIDGLESMGFTELTPIQEQVIMPIIDGKDVIGQAQTGTGKTAAFAIPVLNNLDLEINKPQCLILCPTRELAVQVKKEIKNISAFMDVRSTAVYGGAPIIEQIRKIKKGSHIIVGTPGRTIDLINRNVIKFDAIKTIILDEADEMLKMGFREDIEIILENKQNDVQTLLFSATIPTNVISLKNKYQKDPVFLKTNTKDITSDNVDQSYYVVKHSNKIEALARIIDIYSPKLALVFCNTKKKVDEVADQMIEKGYNCDKIHGDIKQSSRMDVLNRFNNGLINVLVATDVAARGLDIKHVEAVINYDVPEKEDYYVHRIGRTGRAGEQGYSFTLTSSRELDRIQSIERYTKKMIDMKKIPSAEKVLEVKKEKIAKDIYNTIRNEDLSDMLSLSEMLYESDTDPKEIIAALLKMNYSLKMEGETADLNEKIVKKREKYSEKSFDKGHRTHDRGAKGNERNLPFDKDAATTDRYYIAVGKKDKVKPRDILGAVTGECGVSGEDIAKIDIYETFSFFNASVALRKTILSKMKNVKIKDRIVSAEITRKRK